MAILNFVKPDKIVLQKSTDFEAQFEFRPLEPGYGVTIGNALRRTRGTRANSVCTTHVFIFAAQQAGSAFDNSDIAAKSPEHLAEFESNVTSTYYD